VCNIRFRAQVDGGARYDLAGGCVIDAVLHSFCNIIKEHALTYTSLICDPYSVARKVVICGMGCGEVYL